MASPDAAVAPENRRLSLRKRAPVASSLDKDFEYDVNKAVNGVSSTSSGSRLTPGSSGVLGKDNSLFEEMYNDAPPGEMNAIQSFLMQRLRDYVVASGGNPATVANWKVEIGRRKGTLLGSVLDVVYIASNEKRYRSRGDAGVAIGLYSYARSMKFMCRREMTEMASELRERTLLAHQIDMYGGRCKEIRVEGDELIVVPEDLPSPSKDADTDTMEVTEAADGGDDLEAKPPTISVYPPQKAYFGLGNATVLSWGRIIHAPAFHTKTQLFPLGFKCIRQERDLALDKIVDCLCEIDAVRVPPKGGGGVAPSDPDANLVPLFRITISWPVNDMNDEKYIRVYEGKSPQLAWQAAMLETIGTEGSEATEVAKTILSEAASDPNIASMEFEGVDEEEKMLRLKLMDARRDHMRSLHRAQSSGVQTPVKPRLSIDAVDSFFDESLLRLVEGMNGVAGCENYEYLELRSTESGHKAFIYALANSQDLMKHLESIYENMCEPMERHLYPERFLKQKAKKKPAFVASSTYRQRLLDDVETYADTGGAASLGNGVDASRRLQPRSVTDKERDESNKQMKIQVVQERRSKARELEKMLRGCRENCGKNLIIRRNEARGLVESACELEEIELFRKISPFYSLCQEKGGLWISNARVGLMETCNSCCSDATDEKSHAAMEIDGAKWQAPFERPRFVYSKYGDENAVLLRQLGGDALGAVLDIWSVLYTCAPLMDIVQVPTPQALMSAIISCDLSTRQRLMSVKRSVHALRNQISSTSTAKTHSARADLNSLSDRMALLETLESLSNEVKMDVQTAESLLSKVSLAFCKLLLPDFYHWMSVNENLAVLGDTRPALNELTWREIARTVLTVTIMQTLQMSEVNIAAAIRGKGHTTAPDTLDRRTLRIARKRVLTRGGAQIDGYQALPTEASGPVEMNLAGSFTPRKVFQRLAALAIRPPGDPQADQRGDIIFELSNKHNSCFTTFARIQSLDCAACAALMTDLDASPSTSDVVVCNIPTPDTAKMAATFWAQLERSLARSADHDPSQIRLLIASALERIVLMTDQLTPEAVSISRLLGMLLQSDFGSDEDIRQLKLRALRLVHHYMKIQGYEKDAVSASIDDAQEESIAVPVSIIEAWEYQQKHVYAPTARAMRLSLEDGTCIDSALSFLDELIASGTPQTSLIDWSTAITVSPVVLELISSLSVEKSRLRLQHLAMIHGMRSKIEAARVMEEEALAAAKREAAGADSDEEEAKNGANNAEDVELDRITVDRVGSRPKDSKGRYLSNKAIQSLKDAGKYDSFVADALSRNTKVESAGPESMEVEPFVVEDVLVHKWEADWLRLLPDVYRRCYAAIEELMFNPLASAFNYSFDFESSADYLSAIRRPLCLADVRQCLLEQGYGSNNVLVSFHRDVSVIFENALAFNEEYNPLVQAALKMGVVFERLYMDVILAVEQPPWTMDSCTICRALNPIGDEAVLCDRCDAVCHLACLDPPLAALPKGDWYCPHCVSGKRINAVHPCLGLLVHCPGPDGGVQTGRVVDFVPIGVKDDLLSDERNVRRHSMEYVVAFGKQRANLAYLGESLDTEEAEEISDDIEFEIWDGTKVRQSCCQYVVNQDGIIVLESCAPPALPDGFNYTDYDEACTLVRGHAGWSNLSIDFPSVLSGAVFVASKTLIAENKAISDYQRALCALSPRSNQSALSSTAIFGSVEWIAVLTALAKKAGSASVVENRCAALDEECTRMSGALLDSLMRTKSLSSLNIETPGLLANLMAIASAVHKDSISRAPKVGTTLRFDYDAVEEGEGEEVTEESPAGLVAKSPSHETKSNVASMQLKGTKASAASLPMDAEDSTDTDSMAGEEEAVFDDDFDDEMDGAEDETSSRPSTPAAGGGSIGTSGANGATEEGKGAVKKKLKKKKMDMTSVDERTAWICRRTSRRRGVEDALFTAQLLRDVLKELDTELAQDYLIEKNLVKTLSGTDQRFNMSYYAKLSLILPTIVKFLLQRPPDYVDDVGEWLRGWSVYHNSHSNLLQSLCPEGSSEIDGPKAISFASDPKCELCGFDECSVGSMLVKFETRDEWDDNDSIAVTAHRRMGVRADGKTVPISFPEGQLDEELRRLVQAIRNELNWDFASNTSNACTQFYSKVLSHLSATNVEELMSSLSRLNWRVMREKERDYGVLWTPLVPDMETLERSDRLDLKGAGSSNEANTSASNKKMAAEFEAVTIRAGSMIAHESCAEYMHTLRKLSTQRVAQKTIISIADTLIGLSRGKNVPIGCDSFGNLYWAFPGVKNTLFVCSPSHPRRASDFGIPAEIVASKGISFPPDYSSLERRRELLQKQWVASGGEDVDDSWSRGTHDSRVNSWHIVSGVPELLRLARWLDVTVHCEHQLLLVLELLYPQILLGMHDALNSEPSAEVSTRVIPPTFDSIWDAVMNSNNDKDISFLLTRRLDGDVSGGASGAAEVEDDTEEVTFEEEGELEAGADSLIPLGALVGKKRSRGDVAADEDSTESERGNDNGDDRKDAMLNDTSIVSSSKSISDTEEEVMAQQPKRRGRPPKVRRVIADDDSDVEGAGPTRFTMSTRRRQSMPPAKAGGTDSSTSALSLSMSLPATAPHREGNGLNMPEPTIVNRGVGGRVPGSQVLVYRPMTKQYVDAVVVKFFEFRKSSSVVQPKRPGRRAINQDEAMYLVRCNLGEETEFEEWVPYKHVYSLNRPNQQAQLDAMNAYLGDASVYPLLALPPILTELRSYGYLYDGGKGRWNIDNPKQSVHPSISHLLAALAVLLPRDVPPEGTAEAAFYSRWDHCMASLSSKNSNLIKAAMLIVEAALPSKSIDDSDERGGLPDERFFAFWRAAVIRSNDASSLMECQIMLEYCVRTAWLASNGTKLLTCMPSRTTAVRCATYGLVAMRLWALDEAIRFDKHSGDASSSRAGGDAGYDSDGEKRVKRKYTKRK